MNSDEYDYGNDNCQKDPPAQLNALFKISNTGCHRSTIYECRFSTSTTTDQTDITDTIPSFVIPNIRLIHASIACQVGRAVPCAPLPGPSGSHGSASPTKWRVRDEGGWLGELSKILFAPSAIRRFNSSTI